MSFAAIKSDAFILDGQSSTTSNATTSRFWATSLRSPVTSYQSSPPGWGVRRGEDRWIEDVEIEGHVHSLGEPPNYLVNPAVRCLYVTRKKNSVLHDAIDLCTVHAPYSYGNDAIDEITYPCHGTRMAVPASLARAPKKPDTSLGFISILFIKNPPRHAAR